MNIQNLQEFVTLSQHLKLSSAAQELYISAPTLSQHISAIEKELNIPLFLRTSTGLRLTSEGEAALTIAQKILNQYSELKDLSQPCQETLRWRVPNYFAGLRQLLKTKARYLEDHPNCVVNVETNELQMDDPFRILQDNESDIAVLYVAKNSQKTIADYLRVGFEAIGIGAYRTIFVSEARHPLTQHERLTLADINRATLVTTLCPVTNIHMETIKLALADQGAAVRSVGLKVNRHTDVFTSDLGDSLVPWFRETPIFPAFDPSDFHFHDTDFDLISEAFLLFMPENLSSAQRDYLNTMQALQASQET